MDEFVIAEKYAGRSTAEVYVELALAIIKLPATPSGLWPGDTEDGLRGWWVDETENRQKHDLTPAQTDAISSACKSRVDLLRATAKKKRPVYKRKSMI